MSPVNQQELPKLKVYKPTEEDADILADLENRIDDLKKHRSGLKANPYDASNDARSLEATWDFDDFVALPHKYSHREMRDWMAKNSRPLTYAKIDTAISILISKNPEAEISARTSAFEKKTKILEALYALSWDKGRGRQQLIKLVCACAKYGFAVGREYHRFKKELRKEIIGYDPETLKHETQEIEKVIHDEPYFEVLPIRDCWFDNRAKPYDEDSLRDWCWKVKYDRSTFEKEFPVKVYPNAKYVGCTQGDYKDKAEVDIQAKEVEVYFYENEEDNEFLVVDANFKVLIYKGELLNGELSCVPVMWRIRNEQTIYGIGLPEILENDQELLDKIANMTVNQVILAIGGAGYYGGQGNLTEQDALLEPKLKKLRDADKISFPKIPMPDANVYKALEDIKNEADEYSGVTKSLVGEEVGKTLGEAMLNKEAGIRRLSIPLGNIEFALERHARLRIDNIQRIYSRATKTEVVVDDFGNVVNDKLYQEYLAERGVAGETPSLVSKFPMAETGAIYRNQYKEERLPFEKTNEGEIQSSTQDKWLEITPAEIGGEYDVKIRALSTVPLSKALEEAKALETFNIVAKLPYTDIYKAERKLLKTRGEDPDEWMISEEQIMQTQQQAAMGSPVPLEEGRSTGSAEKLIPPNEMKEPAQMGSMVGKVRPGFKMQ